MRAKITFDMAFDVNLDNDEILAAIREHDDAEGDATHAAVIEARERVHRILNDATSGIQNIIDTHELNVREAHVDSACEVCGASGGDEYTTHTGVSMCAVCVNRVLAYRVMRDVIDNIEDYDTDLARAISFLDDDDNAMRQTNMPYVDSLSNGWDTLRGESHDGACAFLNPLFNVVVDATREPGSVIAR